MGGGGGINPLSIISSVIFGPAAGMAVGLATADKAASTAASDAAARQATIAAAEARRRADRQKAEAGLLAKARQAERDGQDAADAGAESLGAPTVAASGLKERLGQ